MSDFVRPYRDARANMAGAGRDPQFDMFLRSMGFSPDQYANLPPRHQQEIESQFRGTANVPAVPFNGPPPQALGESTTAGLPDPGLVTPTGIPPQGLAPAAPGLSDMQQDALTVGIHGPGADPSYPREAAGPSRSDKLGGLFLAGSGLQAFGQGVNSPSAAEPLGALGMTVAGVGKLLGAGAWTTPVAIGATLFNMFGQMQAGVKRGDRRKRIFDAYSDALKSAGRIYRG